MSSKLAFVSTLGLILLLNGFAVGAVTHSLAKDTKKKGDKPAVTSTIVTAAQGKEKKKDDTKKEITWAAYHPTYVKPSAMQSYHHSHCHHRYGFNA